MVVQMVFAWMTLKMLRSLKGFFLRGWLLLLFRLMGFCFRMGYRLNMELFVWDYG